MSATAAASGDDYDADAPLPAAPPACPASPPTSPPRPLRIRVCTLGDGRVGKSSLVKRYCEARFPPRAAPTIGVDYGVRALPPGAVGCARREVRVNFFDLAGGAAYADVRSEFYADAHGLALLAALDSRPSFDHLDGWLAEARAHGGGAAAAVLIGAKADAPPPAAFARAEAQAWAAAHGMRYFEASAATGEGVHEALDALFAAAAAVALEQEAAAAAGAAAAGVPPPRRGGAGAGSGGSGGGAEDEAKLAEGEEVATAAAALSETGDAQ